MTENGKVKLREDDWAALFPQQPFMVGTTTLYLKPLSLSGIAKTMTHLKLISKKIQDSGIDLLNFQPNLETITCLVAIVLTYAPEILSEMSGLDVEDVQQLPLDLAVNLLSVCLDINIKSQDGLIKNFKRLGEKVATMTQTNPLQ